MIVNAAELTNFPADGHAFEQIIFEDEIAGVAAFGEIEIFVERFGNDMMLHDEVLNVFESEILCEDGSKIFDPVGDGELIRSDVAGNGRPPREL
jgi:hypothetical protein